MRSWQVENARFSIVHTPSDCEFLRREPCGKGAAGGSLVCRGLEEVQHGCMGLVSFGVQPRLIALLGVRGCRGPCWSPPGSATAHDREICSSALKVDIRASAGQGFIKYTSELEFYHAMTQNHIRFGKKITYPLKLPSK